MSIKESALSAISSLAQGDFIRVVTSAGASRRISFANLAASLIKSTIKSYTVTVSAGGYALLSDYETLGISADRIIGYTYTSGSYPIVLQFATEGIYLFSSSAISNRAISVKIFYV